LPDVLAKIVARKREEVADGKAQTTIHEFEVEIIQGEEPRNFFTALTRHENKAHTAVIAEVKRKSPSAGWIRPEYASDNFKPEEIAASYHEAGASAISCLTDRDFFGGDLSYIKRIKDRVPLPVLRKDFIIDPWQVWESRAAGADAILLIAECLTVAEILDLMILAQQLKLTVLMEVHDASSLERVKQYVGFPHRSYCLLGINNRDLRSMTVDLDHTIRMAKKVEDTSILVSESGIKTTDDLRKLRRNDVRIVLVGEHLMRQDDPGAALKTLLGR
jgi:indole-3-glycerol phosphate synthase